MDCQMPLMDGFEATREIREREGGKSRIPIVAVTANVMKSDEEKCRAAGMDDFISKPIDRAKLKACLDRLVPSAGTSALLAIRDLGIIAKSENTPVDWRLLLESFGGDEAFARELAGAFIETADRELALIAAALDAGDAASLRSAAHALKGASANMRASAATAAAAEVEAISGGEDRARLPALAEKLTREVRSTIEYLRSVA
jgi:CheY-like chemotaxis protein